MQNIKIFYTKILYNQHYNWLTTKYTLHIFGNQD